MTAVTVQSNKVVSNEVQGHHVLLEPSYRENQTNFLANPVLKSMTNLSLVYDIYNTGKQTWYMLAYPCT